MLNYQLSLSGMVFSNSLSQYPPFTLLTTVSLWGKKNAKILPVHFPDLLAAVVEAPQNDGVCFQLLMKVMCCLLVRKTTEYSYMSVWEKCRFLGKCVKYLSVFIYFVSLTELYSKNYLNSSSNLV